MAKRYGFLLLLLIPVGVGVYAYFSTMKHAGSGGEGVKEASEEQVRAYCAACHAFPPPDSFPRKFWRHHVDQGFVFTRDAGMSLDAPSAESLYAYYENRAPVALSLPDRPNASGLSPVASWTSRGYAVPGRQPQPVVTNVNLVRLRPNDKGLKVLVCECDPRAPKGKVLLFDPQTGNWTELANVPAPATTTVVDLDGDGQLDILVACLGSFFPTNDRVGSVVWLRGKADGTFEPITLLKDVGRVAEVQAADFTGDGKLDLVVAEFGWRKTGGILLMENRTTDWSRPEFHTHILDKRSGTINVPVADLNGDGKPDFVALISQEHEEVVAFLNEGGGKFRKETIYKAPHPAYGSSGIQLADIDGDGDLDVIYTNGDSLGGPYVLKPYEGIHLLENKGSYPFVPHRLANMPGVQRAVVADVDGDGDLDIIAVSYLPAVEFPRNELDLDSVLLLEQTGKGTFVRRPMETKTCDHFSCAIGDLHGNGRPSLVVGNFYSTTEIPIRDWLSIWSKK